MMRQFVAKLGAIALACAISLSAQAVAESPARIEIPAGELISALKSLATQLDIELVYQPEQLRNMRTDGVQGTYSPQQAISILLRGTALEVHTDTSGAMVIAPPATPKTVPQPATHTSEQPTSFWSRLRLAQSDASFPSQGEGSGAGERDRAELEEVRITLPEVLVVGSKSLNMDIQRTRDDAQPYVILDRAAIEKSGAANLNDFLKSRLPSNTVGQTNAQLGTNLSGNMSQINLRGLGPNQTLILVDGRRMASSAPAGGSFSQPDLNGIPLSAIERVEVLPSTASGIYGGGATGGVVNVILRRDFSGVEVKASYGNSFDSDVANRTISFGAGASFFDQRTHLLLAGSFSDQNPLQMGERDFTQRGRSRILQNNPAFLTANPNPPLGATPNLRSVNGSPLFGPGTPAFTSVPVGYTGGGGLAAFQANAGTYNLDLAGSDQAPTSEGVSLLNSPTVKSAMMTLRQEIGSRVEVFAELSAANNEGHAPATPITGRFTLPASAATNPFGQAVRVTVPIAQATGEVLSESQSRRAAGGVIFRFSDNWLAEADYTWNRSRNFSTLPGTLLPGAAAAINSGALDILRDPAAVSVDFSPYAGAPLTNGPYQSVMKDTTVRVAGPLFSLPAGPITLTGLLERREETLEDGYQVIFPTLTFFFPSRSQDVDSAYLEAQIPLFSERNRLAGVRSLDLQVAGRLDEYTTRGATGSILNPTPTSVVERRTNKHSSTSPSIGLRYQPVQAVFFRASYSEGFLPPAVDQLISSAPSSGATPVIDPLRGGLTALVPAGQVSGGGNPSVLPEESASWSAGLVFTPAFAAGLRFSADYVRIAKTDEIRSLTPQQIVDSEAFLVGRVTRGAVGPSDPFAVGPITAIDATLVNVARSNIEAYDFALDYDGFRIGSSRLSLHASATWQRQYETQLLPVSPAVNSAGVTSLFPLEWRANAGACGDLARNGNWVEFFSGRMQSLESMQAGTVVARLFTTDHEILHLLATPVLWLKDDETVAFLWNDGKRGSSVTTLNLRTGKAIRRAEPEGQIESFDISADGETILFSTLGHRSSYAPAFGRDMSPEFARMLWEGFAVPESAYTLDSLLNGYADDRARGFYSYSVWIQRGRSRPRKLDIPGYMLPPLTLDLSPDGRRAIALAPPRAVPAQWARYDSPQIRRNVNASKRHPLQPNQLRQMWLVDTHAVEAQPLWNVPYVMAPSLEWSENGDRLRVTNTLLPIDSSNDANVNEVASVEVDLSTGTYSRLAEQAARKVPEPGNEARQDLRVELREGPNEPPVLYAVDTRSSQEAVIRPVDSRTAEDFRLSRVEILQWTDRARRAWTGRLYYPLEKPSAPAPLVILTAPRTSVLPQQFSVRGSELVSTLLSIAQPLANQGMAVLVMGQPDDPRATRAATVEEGGVVIDGYLSAIDLLVDKGIVDRNRVGIAGYSRTGYYVQYALTHSDFPFAAAISADNVDESYLQYVLSSSAWARDELESTNGAKPYGEGMDAWLRQAPGFNADRIRTPLRMEINNGGITALLGQWELFSHLRNLERPVELYVIPDIDHGSHGLFRPAQQLASMTGALDWMDFWLNGSERADEAKEAQYARWRRLRKLRDRGGGDSARR